MSTLAKMRVSTLERMAQVAESLRVGRAEVNQFAATQRDPAARGLMATSVDSHITALSRLRNQLLQPATIFNAERAGKCAHHQENQDT